MLETTNFQTLWQIATMQQYDESVSCDKNTASTMLTEETNVIEPMDLAALQNSAFRPTTAMDVQLILKFSRPYLIICNPDAKIPMGWQIYRAGVSTYWSVYNYAQITMAASAGKFLWSGIDVGQEIPVPQGTMIRQAAQTAREMVEWALTPAGTPVTTVALTRLPVRVSQPEPASKQHPSDVAQSPDSDHQDAEINFQKSSQIRSHANGKDTADGDGDGGDGEGGQGSSSAVPEPGDCLVGLGWQRLFICEGDENMKRAAWVQAHLRGIPVVGYEPDQTAKRLATLLQRSDLEEEKLRMGLVMR